MRRAYVLLEDEIAIVALAFNLGVRFDETERIIHVVVAASVRETALWNRPRRSRDEPFGPSEKREAAGRRWTDV
jgi:hypothetical protein